MHIGDILGECLEPPQSITRFGHSLTEVVAIYYESSIHLPSWVLYYDDLSFHNYILRDISVSTPDVSKVHTFTPTHFWQPSLLLSSNIFNRSIYLLLLSKRYARAFTCTTLKNFPFLPVAINNYSVFAFINCHSKKLSISPVKSFHCLRWNVFFQDDIRKAMTETTVVQNVMVSIGQILIGYIWSQITELMNGLCSQTLLYFY